MPRLIFLGAAAPRMQRIEQRADGRGMFHGTST